MSKEKQIQLANKIKENYDCKVLINNNEEPYFLICFSDLCKILNIKNSGGRSILKDNKVMIKNKTLGGEQNMTFITYNGLINYISKSRKPYVIDFCKKLNIDIFSRIYTCIEADTLKCIIDAFSNEENKCQYRIKTYLVDLYFPKYKLIIECDEKFHNYKLNSKKDILRENDINNEDIYTFIRYSPYDENFNIFKVINKIIVKLYKNN